MATLFPTINQGLNGDANWDSALREVSDELAFPAGSDQHRRTVETVRTRFGETLAKEAFRCLGDPRLFVGLTPSQRQTVLECALLYASPQVKFRYLKAILMHARSATSKEVGIRWIDFASEEASTHLFRVCLTVEVGEFPLEHLAGSPWLRTPEATVFLAELLRQERRFAPIRFAHARRALSQATALRDQLPAGVKLTLGFVFPHIEFRINVESGTRKVVSAGVEAPEPMSQPSNPTDPDDARLLAEWSDVELETRFKAGDVSYPEYVLRHMDQFFSPEEQAELRRMAAMHGLEIERSLMEVHLKSRTTEQDLEKLVRTLNMLREKGISASVKSRHEIPSGYIEIQTKPTRTGCLPVLGILSLLTVLVSVLSVF